MGEDNVRLSSGSSSHSSRTEWTDFSFRKVSTYLIIAVALALVADVPESLGGAYLVSKVFLYVLLLASLLFPRRYSLIFLLMISTVCQDITQTQTEGMEQGISLTASMWQGGIGFLRPGWFMIAYCLALLVKGRIYVRDQPVAYAALWFSTVPLITGLVYGGFSTGVAWLEVPIDVKLPMFLLVSILLYRSHLRNRPQELAAFAAAFVGCILARHLIDFAYWLLGIGSEFAEVNRVSVDSTKGTVVFMFFFAMVLIMRQKRFLIGGVLGIVSAVMLVVYTTRGLWLSAMLGVCLLLLLLRARKLVLALPTAALLAYGSFQTMMAIKPENVDLALKRIDRQSAVETGNLLEEYEPNRYAEMLNAADATLKRGAILWGNGYGSYYTESVILFPARMQDAFPDYSLTSGRFYTLHHYVLRTLFEHGLIGFLIISCLWLIPGWRCFKAFRDSPPGLFSNFMMAVIAFLPTSMLEMSWSGKGMIIAGFVIAFCMCAYDHSRNRIGTDDARVSCDSPPKRNIPPAETPKPHAPAGARAEGVS